jgi:hypothetical protein
MSKLLVKAKKMWFNPSTGETSQTKQQGWIYFDSFLEYQVYDCLRYSTNWHIRRPYKIELLSRVSLNRYKPHSGISWDCDLAIVNPKNGQVIPIECKGEWIQHDNAALNGFITKLKLLDYFYPDFSRNLLIVSLKSFSIDSVHTSISLIDLPAKIREITY